MEPRSLEERVTFLERQMHDVRDLPERVTRLESQILQLPQETASAISALRDQLKTDTDETRVCMRVLHEDVLTRLRLIGEGNDSDS